MSSISLDVAVRIIDDFRLIEFPQRYSFVYQEKNHYILNVMNLEHL